MNRILVINCGSSSVKYRVYDAEVRTAELSGLDRIA